MTMQELSGQYAGTAEVLYQRIAELRKQAAARQTRMTAFISAGALTS